MRDPDPVPRYACPSDVAAADDDGRWVLLHLPSGQRLVLSETAGRIWAGLVEGIDSEQLTTTLAGEYDADPQVVAGDLEDLVEQLLAAGLLEPA